MIVETAELSDFFDEFADARIKQKRIEEKDRKTLARTARKLIVAERSRVERFIDDASYRTEVLQLVSKFSIYLVADFIPFLDKCIAETWRRSAPRNAFEGYNQNLTVVLDTLTAFDFERFPPALFYTAAENLERVASLVGRQLGQSYSANRTWETRRTELNAEIVSELTSVAKQYGYNHLRQLLKSVPK